MNLQRAAQICKSIGATLTEPDSNGRYSVVFDKGGVYLNRVELYELYSKMRELQNIQKATLTASEEYKHQLFNPSNTTIPKLELFDLPGFYQHIEAEYEKRSKYELSDNGSPAMSMFRALVQMGRTDLAEVIEELHPDPKEDVPDKLYKELITEDLVDDVRIRVNQIKQDYLIKRRDRELSLSKQMHCKNDF